MGEPCPCCGRALPVDEQLRVDPAGIVVRRGRYATLTKQEQSLFLSLHGAAGRLRTREQLLSDLYWQEADEPEIKIIDVFVCKLRKKLKPLGVDIVTAWGRGYRLSLAAADREAA